MGDDKNPMDVMSPDGDNPEYRRRKAEHEENLGSAAETAAIEGHPYMTERISGQRVRKNRSKPHQQVYRL